MTDAIKLRKIGNSLGIIIPKSDLDRHDWVESSELYILHGPGGMRLVPYDPEFADVIEHARDFMRRHSDAFKELAK